MDFHLQVLRFRLTTLDEVFFPPGKAGNVFRGFLGFALQEVTSHQQYLRLFEPRREGQGPSGLADLPRPFVLRVAHLDGARIAAGRTFEVRVHLFEPGGEAVNAWTEAFKSLEQHGIGPRQGRARLEQNRVETVCVPLAPLNRGISHVSVHFLTPTELKAHGLLAGPDFWVLYSRARDRVATLQHLYGSGETLDFDFRGAGHRAAHVMTVRSAIEHEQVERRSSRTGQVHPLGGFTGEVDYAGELDEFLPILDAAQWTGVGRQTVWGKGEIAVRVPEATHVPQCP